jgi:branched-chain amino acid transport system substrate-binding protein
MRARVVNSWVALAAGGMLIAACASSPGGSSGGSTGAGSSGVIKIGLIDDVTGGNADNYTGAVQAAQARLDVVNAHGGIDGKKLVLVVGDTTSTPQGDLAAAKSLVSQGVLEVTETSLFNGASYQYLHQQGIPVLGGNATDGNEWVDPSVRSNMFGAFGTMDPSRPSFTSEGVYLKSQGVTSLATVCLDVAASSQTCEQMATSGEHAGIKLGYHNYTLPFVGANFQTVALAMKQANVNGLAAAMSFGNDVSLLIAAKEAGVKLKTALVLGGYSQSVVDDPESDQALQGITVESFAAPIELHNAATTAFSSALAKYANVSGVPSSGSYQGWIAADLAVEGLEVAGHNPTKASIIAGLRKVTDYTAGGLLPAPTNFTQFGTGDPVGDGSTCWYGEKVSGKTFVPINNGQPECGTIIPGTNIPGAS